jgi:hypothetical protein
MTPDRKSNNIIDLYSGSGVEHGDRYGLEGHGSILCRGKRFFYSIEPDRFWSPPNFLSVGYRGIFPLGKAAEACR